MTRLPDAPLPIVATPGSRDAWLLLSDNLLWAINHALNNRLAALGSLVRVMEANAAAEDPLLTMLGQEVERLDAVLRLLRIMPRDPMEEPEPMGLAEVLPDVLSLHGTPHNAVPVRYEPAEAEAVQPVLTARSNLVRALLLLLAGAGRVTRDAPSGEVRLRFRDDGDEVVLVVESRPAQGSGEGGAADGGAALQAVESLLMAAGARLVQGEGVVEVCLPSLRGARRREREGGGAG
jgi:hypothetical protein